GGEGRGVGGGRGRRGRPAGVAAGGPTGLAGCRRRGLPEARLAEIAPGVAEAPDTSAGQPPLELPAAARLIAGLGPLERRKGFYEAIWTLDILHEVYPDLHLALTGHGPDEPRLRSFARGTRARGRVHFLREAADTARLLAH